MLEDKTNGYLDKVLAFSDKVNMRAQLEDRLAYLDRYACSDAEPEKTKCLLWSDFAQHSFTFLMMRKNKEGEYKDWFNGGLIFHGRHDAYGSGAPPTLATCLQPTDGWSVHT